jgi:hypothetical protein
MKGQANFLRKLSGIVVMSLVLFVPFVYSADLTSTSFVVKDPIVGSGGGFSTSSSFGSYFSGDLTMIGSGSSSSFEGRYGFLWFPYVVKGVFSAVANGSDADLSWGASTAGLGWNISGYNTGISTVSGGPYTYTSVGLVTNYTYPGLTPGDYCFVLQTLDTFSNVIATSQEECISISAVLTFSISTNSIGFGALSSAGARYANASGGSSSDSADAHTIIASSNAQNGYTITYYGPLLTSGPNTIAGSSSISGAGTPGTSQFGLALSTSGSATIPSGYQHSGPTWSFVANTQTSVATTSGVTSTETFGVRYISNISASAPAGNYSTDLTYVITGNF